MDVIEISWAAGSIDEARKVARYLVQEKYVACAQIIPWMESVFTWNNQLDTAQETKVLLKTTSERFQEVVEVIRKNTTYEVPEITFRKIDGGLDEYLDWVKNSSCAVSTK